MSQPHADVVTQARLLASLRNGVEETRQLAYAGNVDGVWSAVGDMLKPPKTIVTRSTEPDHSL